MAPEIVAPPGFIQGVLGEPVTLNCTAEALPPPTYTWLILRGNESMPLENETDSTLNFDSLRISERGVYSCQAQNELGTATRDNIVLKVEGELT